MNKTINITGDGNTVTAGGSTMGESEELKPLTPTWRHRFAVLGAIIDWLDRRYKVLLSLLVLTGTTVVTCQSQWAQRRADRAEQKAAVVAATATKADQKADAIVKTAQPVENETAARLLILEKAGAAMQLRLEQLERPRARRRPAPPTVVIRPVTRPKQLPASAEAALKQVHPQAQAAVSPPAPQPPVTGKADRD